MDAEYSSSFPHRRWNPLNGDWALVSPHRVQRPWLGRTEPLPCDPRPAFDPRCPLCPGNKRASGRTNPRYTGTFIFDNDFPAILPDPRPASAFGTSLLKAEPIRGICRVLCFSPRHDLTLAQMEIPVIRGVVDSWATQTEELGDTYRWVQVFENKGEMMGCSNPHPHGQVWASDTLPREAEKEDACQAAHQKLHGSVLLRDYLTIETSEQRRIVLQNMYWVVVVPFWAVWPFETLLLPRRHVTRIQELGTEERDALAAILKEILVRYDNLFSVSFPYTMGWHGAPFGDGDGSHWLLHAHFLPPLLRSATVKKFMVGYEMLAEPQRDLTPEQAAERLRLVGSEPAP